MLDMQHDISTYKPIFRHKPHFTSSKLPNESENRFRSANLSRHIELKRNSHALLSNNDELLTSTFHFQLLTLSAFIVLIVLATAHPFGAYNTFTGDFGE
jgi:hypothetical protein